MATYAPQDASGILISENRDTKVTLDGESVPVTGTFWQATQPISAAALPLPTGAATETGKLASIDTAIAAIKTAVEILDNFISGSRGLITEDNSDAIKTAVQAIQSTAGVKKITDALPAGTNLMGKVGIDQTTDGTTNKVAATQGTATNLKAQAECYQGGTAVGAAAPLQVTLANGSVPSHPVTNAGTFAVQASQATAANLNCTEASASAIKTAVEIMDDWDESDRVKANIIVGQAGITAGAGAVAANTPRVTHASDDPAVTALQIIDNMVSGSGANISQINGVAPLMGAGATGTGSPRVTAASDSPEVASLGIMDDWDESDRCKTNPIAGQAGVQGGSGTVTALTQRVVLATDVALPTGSNAIGKLAANSGVDIGDVDVTSLPATPAGTNAIGKLLPPDIDITTHTNYARKYYTNAGAVTDGIIWSPAAGKRWHIMTIAINVSAACTVTLEDDKAGGDDPVYKAEFAANSGVVLTFPEKYPMASGEDAADLLITTTAGNVYVTVVGAEL